MDDFELQRRRLVGHLVSVGCIKTKSVKEAFLNVPRHLFVPEGLMQHSYDDNALPIGRGQTISQPYTVAMMTELLEPEPRDKVLEVGAGSGYQAAIVSKLVKRVFSVEIDGELASYAMANLKKVSAENVEVVHGDGVKGYEKAAPYDKIIVTCACEEVPKALFRQLKIGSLLVAPVGGPWVQELMLYRKSKSGVTGEGHGSYAFVPLRH